MRIVSIDDEQRLLDALVTACRFRWPEADVLTATDADNGLSLALEHLPTAHSMAGDDHACARIGEIRVLRDPQSRSLDETRASRSMYPRWLDA
jgi:hypothetical protein